MADQSDTKLGPWRIWFDPPPVPYCDWHFLHEDYDGEGSPGWMSGSHATRDECLEAIIIHYEERGS